MGINKNFVVRNGLEVATNLLYANDEENRVGINTAIPEYNLDVQGDAKLEGKIVSAGDTSGITGQYIKSTGDGWEWETFPRSRASERYTLVASQTRIPASGVFPSFSLVEQELTSVYLDGVKLTVGDYSIDAGGGSITLFAAAFGGEEIEIIAHGATSVGTGNTGILGITARKAGIASGDAGRITIFDFVGLGVTLDGRSGLCTVHIDSGGLTDVSGDPSPTLGGNLNLDSNDITGTGNISVVGYVTATSFEGDGSRLTGITTLIQAGDFITLTTSGGITTITGQQSGSGTGYFDNDQINAGIHTTSTHVGLGTTNPRFQTEIGAVGAAGTQLWVNGDARITGILTIGTSSITFDGTNDEIRIGTSLTLTSSGSAQYSGVVTATSFDGDLTGQHRVYTAGVSNSDDYTLAMFLNPTQGGHTYNRYDLGQKLQYNPSTGQLSNVGIISATGQIISGVTTHQGEVNFQSNINLGDNNIINVGTGNDLQISHTGSVSKIEESGDGGLEIRANPTITIGKYTSENMGVFNVDGSVDLYYNNSKKFETTPNGTYVTGISSAVSFSGSGIGLTAMVDVEDGTYGGATVSPQITVADGRITGITATLISGGGGGGGTEVIIEDNDSLVGTAGTINFGSGLSVSSATAGVVTVTAASAEVISDTTPQLGGNLDLNSRTINGTGNINVNGSFRFNGPSTCTSDLDVDGTATINALSIPQDTNLFGDVKNITVGNDLKIYSTTSNLNYIITDEYPLLIGVDVEDGGPVIRGISSLIEVNPQNDVYYGNNSHVTIGFGTAGKKLETTGYGVTVYGTTETQQLNVTGVSTLTNLIVSGISSATAESGTFTASAGVAYTANTYSVNSFANAEYTLFFQHSSGIQSQKVLVMDDGTTAYSQEYGIMYSNDLLVSVGAIVKSGNVELQWTPETGVSGIVTFKYSRDMLI